MDIVDGAHHGGNDDVFFLPPLVGNPVGQPGYGDAFQPGLPVEIKIVCLQTAQPPYASSKCLGKDFTPSMVTMSATDEQYMVNWDTKADGVDPGDVFRIEVHIGTETIAWADVFMVPNGNPKNVATQSDIALPDGRTLPIKIRIEKGWDCANRSDKTMCVSQVVPQTAVDGSGSTIVQMPGNSTEGPAGGRFYDGWIPYSDTCTPGSLTCVPTGTPVVVTIEDQTSLLNASGQTCGLKNSDGVPVTRMLTQLGSGESQHPGRCVRFTTNPKFNFAAPVDVAVCIESSEITQQLLKYDLNEPPQFLKNVYFPIVCEPTTIGSIRKRSSNRVIDYALSAISKAGNAVAEVFTPKSAYAVHLGVGGDIGIGGGFSLVGPGEPKSLVKVSADPQTVPAGTTLTVEGSVVTQHDLNKSLTGETVTCTASGAGYFGSPDTKQITVQTQAITDQLGNVIGVVAQCPWTVGAGTNTLQMQAPNIDGGTVAMEDDGEGGTEAVTLTNLQLFTATGTTVDLTVLPGFSITSGSLYFPGDPVSVSQWTVSNQGTATSASYLGQFFLSTDPILTTSDVSVSQAGTNTPLAMGAQQTHGSQLLFIPQNTTQGAYWLGPLVNGDQAAPETNFGNDYQSASLVVMSPTIDFEMLPSGSPACSFCQITTEFVSRGVTFGFSSIVQDATSTVALTLNPNNPENNPNNHSIQNGSTGPGGSFVGTIQMHFASNPTTVQYRTMLNNSITDNDIIAFDASGTPIPSNQVTRTTSTYLAPCVSADVCFTFRQELVTVTSANGISQIYQASGSGTIYLDDMLLAPLVPNHSR